MGFGVGFCRVIWVPPPITTGWSLLSLNMADVVTIIETSKFQIQIFFINAFERKLSSKYRHAFVASTGE